MPPKKRATKRKAVPKRKFIISVKLEIPPEIIDEAQALPEKECNKHVQQYILNKHSIDIKNLSFAKPSPAADELTSRPTTKKAGKASAASLESETEDLGADGYYDE